MLDRAPQPDPTFNTETPDPAHSWAPYQVLNIGNHGPAGLLEYLDAREDALGRKAERNYLPMQPGDVPATFADTTLLNRTPAGHADTSGNTAVCGVVPGAPQGHGLSGHDLLALLKEPVDVLEVNDRRIFSNQRHPIAARENRHEQRLALLLAAISEPLPYRVGLLRILLQ